MKILIIKPSSFGDIIQANPVLTALKKAYPDVRISWLVFKRWAEVITLFPDVDNVIVWDRDLGISGFLRVLTAVRKEHFDIVIDLQGLARSALLAAFSGAKKKAGVPGMKEMSWLFIHEVSPDFRQSNAVYRSLETVRFLTNARQSAVFNLSVPAEAEQRADALLAEYGVRRGDRLAGIIPSARGRGKQWPLENYTQLADRIARTFRGTRVVVMGTREDAGRLISPGAVDLSGKTSLETLAAVQKRCAVVVGGDTGPLHLAAALNVPVVVLFGGSDVTETAPVTPGTTVIKKDYACSPCRGKTPCGDMPCLKAITPEEVFYAVSRCLSQS